MQGIENLKYPIGTNLFYLKYNGPEAQDTVAHAYIIGWRWQPPYKSDPETWNEGEMLYEVAYEYEYNPDSKRYSQTRLEKEFFFNEADAVQATQRGAMKKSVLVCGHCKYCEIQYSKRKVTNIEKCRIMKFKTLDVNVWEYRPKWCPLDSK